MVGPDSDYQVSYMAHGQTEFRGVVDGIIDGTGAGASIVFHGNISQIRITQIGASGSEFQYSLVGTNES